MARKKFTVQLVATVEVILDESLLPDDEWRGSFYNLRTLADVAGHVAYNAVTNGVHRISNLDGFADRDDSLCDVLVQAEDIEVELVTDGE